jgi:hypothetical protein
VDCSIRCVFLHGHLLHREDVGKMGELARPHFRRNHRFPQFGTLLPHRLRLSGQQGVQQQITDSLSRRVSYSVNESMRTAVDCRVVRFRPSSAINRTDLLALLIGMMRSPTSLADQQRLIRLEELIQMANASSAALIRLMKRVTATSRS